MSGSGFLCSHCKLASNKFQNIKCPDPDSFVHILRLEAINSRLFKCPDPDSFVLIVSLQALNSRIFKCPDPDSFVDIVSLQAINYGSEYLSVRIRIVLFGSNKFQNISVLIRIVLFASGSGGADVDCLVHL